MRRAYLRDAGPGDNIDDIYCVSGKQLAAASNGSHYIKVQVSDRSTQLNARMWKATREIFAAMPESGFIRIFGRVENYQNNLQLIIEQFWLVEDGSFDIADLLPHTQKDIPTMCGKIVEILGSIQNRHLAALVQAYLDDQDLMDNLCRAPAAQSFHHAYIGGLLEHTLNAIEVADALARFYPGLNRDLVVAGIFLHDIAKTWELSYEAAFGYTDGGHLVGHIVKSAMWVDEKRKLAEEMLQEKIPQNLIDVIQHIILSHHGLPEFGAAKLPATPEALAVHLIENMDAKLTTALAATRGARSEGEGVWTEFNKMLGGKFYRPDVAPAEAPVESASAETEPVRAPALKLSEPEAVVSVGELKINNPLFETVKSK